MVWQMGVGFATPQLPLPAACAFHLCFTPCTPPSPSTQCGQSPTHRVPPIHPPACMWSYVCLRVGHGVLGVEGGGVADSPLLACTVPPNSNATLSAPPLRTPQVHEVPLGYRTVSSTHIPCSRATAGAGSSTQPLRAPLSPPPPPLTPLLSTSSTPHARITTAYPHPFAQSRKVRGPSPL